MPVFLVIATLWLLVGVTWIAIFCRLDRRPLSDTDRLCGQIDRALLRDYGAGFRRLH